MKTVFPTLEGDADSFTTEGHIHRGFHSSGSAYGACQVCEQIKDGDVLVIEREGVVGVADTWPFAVTCYPGALHSVMEGTTQQELEISAALPAYSIQRACDEAKRLGYELRNWT